VNRAVENVLRTMASQRREFGSPRRAGGGRTRKSEEP
jgi:hypothetical protein